MSIASITEAVRAGDYAPRTEGVSWVVMTSDEALARQAGPLLAERLDPSRRWGRVLHVERISDDRFDVVVEDLGIRTSLNRPAGKAF